MTTRAALTLRHALALSLVASALVATHLVQTHRIAGMTGDARTIDVGGMQRMLSQRVALLAREWSLADDPTESVMLAGKLASALNTMAGNHETLSAAWRIRAERGEAPYVELTGEDGLDAMVKRFIASGRSPLEDREGRPAPCDRDEETVRRLAEIARNGFLAELDAVVARNERESVVHADAIGRIATIVTVVDLALLLLEAPSSAQASGWGAPRGQAVASQGAIGEAKVGRMAPSGAAPCSPRRGARGLGPRRRLGAVLGAGGVGPGLSVSGAPLSASDDRVVGYEITRDDTVPGVRDTLGYIAGDLAPGRGYNVAIVAIDSVEQRSGRALARVEMPDARPNRTDGLSANVCSAAAAGITWQRSGVFGERYEVGRDGGGESCARGSLIAEAADGSRLTLDADNGDPASFTLTVEADGGVSAFTVPVGGGVQVPWIGTWRQRRPDRELPPPACEFDQGALPPRADPSTCQFPAIVTSISMSTMPVPRHGLGTPAILPVPPASRYAPVPDSTV